MFLFGMHLMGESLERQAGRRLKSILGQLTNKPLKGVLLGTAVTAVIQSSSATTVMVVGFVNSGIMQLNQAIPVIMGANIGTTITSWILSLTGIRSDSLLMTLLKPSTFSPLIAFAGIVLLLTSRRRRDTAGIMLGFSVLMFGMEQMSAAVAGLAEVPAFRELLVLFTNPLFGVAVGALVTAIIQSSSASVGILQAIANTGSLTYGAALPIIMGQNIGTCITAILSSIGANRNAKRVGMVHLYFNLIGTGVFLSVFYVLDWLIGFTFTALPINAFGIAVAHTAFNIGTVILLYPMRSLLEWLARKTIRDSKESEKLELLDQRLLNTPSVAIEQCRRLTVDMANLAQQAFLLADGLLDQYDAKAATEVEEIEQTVDRYEDRLGAYLLQVSALHLSEYESKEVSKLLYSIGDFERISDHAVNLTEVAQELHTKNIGFSPEAQVETSTMRAAVKEIMALTVKVFDTNNQELARKVEPLEEVVDVLRETIKANHIERLRTGTCTIELGFVLSDLLTNLERISDHCSNIAVNVMEQTGRGGLESHAYLHELHEGAPNSSFRMQYEAYLNKYDIASKLDELALPEGAE
jgi:phosphate:Na+ symporter